MATDYAELAKEIQGIVEDLGLKKEEVQQVSDRDGENAQVQQALDAVDQLTSALQHAMEDPMTDQERQDKLADLDSKINLAQVTAATDPDYTERIEAQRELTVLLSAKAGIVESRVLQFGDLIGEDGQALKAILIQAGNEIQARQDLARVLKGIEMVMRVGAFAGAAAAKLASAAAG